MSGKANCACFRKAALSCGWLLCWLSPVIAHAAGWTCRNEDLEIHCRQGACKPTEAGGFTPIQVDVGDDGRSLGVCAYSGCWKGKARAMKSGPHLLISGRALAWSGVGGDSADFMVAIDASDRVGFVKGEGFAMPMTCLASH